MPYYNRLVFPASPQTSLLSLSERLIVLARDAERAGLGVASEHLLHLASEILDHPDRLRS